jgi:cytochrome b561
MMKNTSTSYGSVGKFVHWLMAAMVITMLIVGFSMDSFDEPLKSQVYGFHEEFGLTLMGVLIFRLYWRWVNPQPELPVALSAWEKVLSRLTHYLLYIALAIMIASGWAKSTSSGYTPNFYGLFELPMPFIPISKTVSHFVKQVHVTTVWILITLVSLHILAALNHHFIYKDNVLKRMLPSWNTPTPDPSPQGGGEQKGHAA